jgi:soluble lytic murein transglycosylase-like protein
MSHSGEWDGSGTPCAIPQYICDRESGGDPTVYNQQGSGASGKYQAMPGTWGGYAGYANAADAPEEVQDQWAAELWDGGNGCAHWSAC